MEYKFDEKFGERHIEDFTNIFYTNFKKNPNDKYIFNLEKTEWISNQGLLLFASLLKYLYSKKIKFKIIFPQLDERTGSRKIQQIAELWYVWKISKIITTEASYIVECKRLDSKNPNNKSGLYNSYIKEGINRFVNEKYPTFYGVSGMIGFIVEKTDIKSQCNFFTDFESYELINDFDFSYRSEHQTIKNKKIILYCPTIESFISVIGLFFFDYFFENYSVYF